MRVPGVVHAISAATVAFSAAGCGDSTGPVADLRALGARLALVDSLFASPVVRSVGFFELALPFLPSPATAPLVPDSLLGKTLAWSCTTQRYAVSGASGAPATGVRLTLYALAANGAIACPAMVIGQLDLFDVSTSSTRALRATASDVSGVQMVGYTISHVTTDPPSASTASGSLSDGHERLSFAVTRAPGSVFGTGVATVRLDESAADFHELLHEEWQMGVDTYGEDLDLTANRAASSVELRGTAAWFNTVRSWDETIAVNNAPFAKVGGNGASEGGVPTILPLAPPPFFTHELFAILLDLVNAPGTVTQGLARVLGAGTHLVAVP